MTDLQEALKDAEHDLEMGRFQDALLIAWWMSRRGWFFDVVVVVVFVVVVVVVVAVVVAVVVVAVAVAVAVVAVVDVDVDVIVDVKVNVVDTCCFFSVSNNKN